MRPHLQQELRRIRAETAATRKVRSREPAEVTGQLAGIVRATELGAQRKTPASLLEAGVLYRDIVRSIEKLQEISPKVLLAGEK